MSCGARWLNQRGLFPIKEPSSQTRCSAVQNSGWSIEHVQTHTPHPTPHTPHGTAHTGQPTPAGTQRPRGPLALRASPATAAAACAAPAPTAAPPGGGCARGRRASTAAAGPCRSDRDARQSPPAHAPRTRTCSYLVEVCICPRSCPTAQTPAARSPAAPTNCIYIHRACTHAGCTAKP
eukprot:353380-Chlamydomonas_euryale.AAC.4